jgi:alpha-glucosidase
MNVEESDPKSSWALYKKSLTLRHSHPALGGEGTVTWVNSPDGIMHFTREPGLEVVVNTFDTEIEVQVTGSSVLLESETGSALQDGRLTIAANTTIWLQR